MFCKLLAGLFSLSISLLNWHINWHTVAARQICFILEMSVHHFCQAEREKLSDYIVLLKLSMPGNCAERYTEERMISPVLISLWVLQFAICHQNWLFISLQQSLTASNFIWLNGGCMASFQQDSNFPFILSSWFLFQLCF